MTPGKICKELSRLAREDGRLLMVYSVTVYIPYRLRVDSGHYGLAWHGLTKSYLGLLGVRLLGFFQSRQSHHGTGNMPD